MIPQKGRRGGHIRGTVGGVEGTTVIGRLSILEGVFSQLLQPGHFRPSLRFLAPLVVLAMKQKPRRKLRRSHPGPRIEQPQGATAIVLLKQLRDGIIDPKTLSANQRRSCLAVVADGSKLAYELAALFQVTQKVIRNDLAYLRRQVGKMVSEWDLEAVVGDLYMARERCVKAATKQGDPGLVWTIHKEFAKVLIDMGVVERKNDRESFEITIKAVGERYEAAAQAITEKLDPAVTGEVGVQAPRLPLPERVPDSEGKRSEWPDLEPE